MIQDLFCPYDQSFMLKLIGFAEPCFCHHLWDGTDLNKEFENKLSNILYNPKRNSEFPNHIAAPLKQQAFKFFRSKWNN